MCDMLRTGCFVFALLSAAAFGSTTPAAPAPTPEHNGSGSAATPPIANDITEVVFSFHDSSVPPPYHRSWVVTITPSAIRKVVDSYGDVISDSASALTAAQFAEIAQALSTSGLRVTPAVADPSPECTGGTGHSLRVTRGAAVEEGHVSHCGGDHSGTLTGDASGFTSAIAPFLPGEQDAPTAASGNQPVSIALTTSSSPSP